MLHLKSHLTKALKEALARAYPELSAEKIDLAQSQFAHYQCNNAMQWAKKLLKSPREIAQKLVEHLDTKTWYIARAEIAGPGFINLSLSPDFLAREVIKLFDRPFMGLQKSGESKRLVIDFSSPNIAKEMHVGHLRSTIIGDCIARTFEALDYDVLRLNHIGDWGTSFGMLIAFLKESKEPWQELPKAEALSFLEKSYRQAKKRFDEHSDFADRSRAEVSVLQREDPESMKIWEKICDVSRSAYEKIYELLDVSLEERGESFYRARLAPLIEELEDKELIVESEGAKCIFLEGFLNREGNALPFLLQKSDSAYNYATTDMAAIRHRLVEEKADLLIYVTDAGQSTHFQMLFAAAKKAAFVDPNKHSLHHVSFGLVLDSSGKRFRTRSGETEKLIDLLHTAIDTAKGLLEERGVDSASAQDLGIAAIKYADLSTVRTSNYQFSYDKMLAFEGNTAAFLLYAHVRTSSILRKAKALPSGALQLKHPRELSLSLHLLQFPETIEKFLEELSPHRLCDYLYRLAGEFNLFFRDCRVLGDPSEASRLQLCALTNKILGQGFSLLGISPLKNM